MATRNDLFLVIVTLASTFRCSHAFWTRDDYSVTFENYQMRRNGSQLRTLCSLLATLVSWLPGGVKLGSLGCETIPDPALHCIRETPCPDTNFPMSQISNDSWVSSEVASWVACSDLCWGSHGTQYWRWSSEGVCLKGWTWTYQEKSRTCYYYQGEQYYQIS